jgi:hypothetical protein
MRALLALLALWLPAAALADYRSDYREGVIAAERQDWAKVEFLMRRAIAEQPAPDPQARIRVYGASFVPYVPYFYLGLAAFSRGDCATAISLFEDARHAGAVRGLRENDRQAMMLRTCKARLGTAVAAPAAAAQPTTAAPAPAAVSPPRAAAAAPAPTPPAPRPGASSASPQSAAAAASTRDQAPAQSADERPDRAGAGLADARQALERALAKGERQLAQASDPESVEAQAFARALKEGRASLAGAPDGARLQGALQAIEAAGRTLDVAQARRALAGQVRGRLQPLAQAYLGGDFARAAQWDEAAALSGVPQALAEALLIRAAARFELYVLGGERDLVQFDQIRDDVRAARQAAPDIQPAEKAYSPRFRALFASTR